MVSIKVDVKGYGDLIKRLNKTQLRLTEVQRAIALSAEQVRGAAVASIQRGTRTGAVYSRQKGRRFHRASAPGEPPKSDTGHLASHIFARMRNKYAEVGTSVWYGGYWERGAPPGKRRPWLQPALDKNEKAILNRIRRAVRKAMRK